MTPGSAPQKSRRRSRAAVAQRRRGRGRSAGRDYLDDADDNRFATKTASLSWTSIEIHFGKYRHTLSNPRLFLVGAGVGLLSSALGVGGGFLLVPIFAMVYRMPLYVMVAATIPYIVVLSFVGILTFMFVLPAFGTAPIQPEWSWGFFTAAGGLFGSWCASKTQLHIPEHLLNWLLGRGTVIVGLLYVASLWSGCRSHCDRVERRMKKFILVILLVLSPGWAAAAGESNHPRKHLSRAHKHRATNVNRCAQYGPGFAPVAGSDICMKIGGSMDVEGGVGR